ncbi:4'-phosphopantetheinyl transferase superfamily protein [uncultured Intestinimonas sp.]|uniref:4'-phosphopantetheinyl transferase family protein n=1 Tax=uncultured Intestinimonas sp. TaxID=1689265 RepID=UPI0025D906C6|nr:4'-phosphopantetheinyl transferase superfamily protein [uncultured Intestinimonas sp.]
MTELWLARGADGRGAAHRLLSLAWERMRGGGPLPEVEQGPAGKPRFRTEGLWHNLSHSGPWGLCGLSDRGEIGVDVEEIRPRRPGLPRHVLSERERRWFEDRGRRWEDFYTLWTLKEARVKQMGSGLDRPARTIAVPLLEPGETGEQDGLRFAAWGGAGWRAAFCGTELPVFTAEEL